MTSNRYMILAAALTMAASTTATLAETPDIDERLQQAEQRLAELEGRQSENWLDERRVEQVKSLIREVLSDADMRASLAEGQTAGHTGGEGGFFISSEDGSFLLNVGGQIQVRHMWNFQNDDDDTAGAVAGFDETERGFTIPRAKLKFSGHIADPRLQYRLVLNVEEDNNEAVFQEILISYEYMDGMTVWAGETKAPFLREELIDSAHQLALERSLINEVFTMGYVQGIGIDWFADKGGSDQIRIRAAFSDGIRSGEMDNMTDADLHFPDGDRNDKQFDIDNNEFALTGRVDMRLMGSWEQGDDFTAWSGEEMSLIIGAAGQYEEAEIGDNSENHTYWSWTVDASFENEGFNAYGAIVGLHIDSDAAGFHHPDHFGYLLQAGYHVIPDTLEPFARLEYLDLSEVQNNDEDEEITLITVGLNYYLAKHAAKVTTDVVYALNGIPGDASLGMDGNNLTMLGLLEDEQGEQHQVVWRVQLQLLF